MKILSFGAGMQSTALALMSCDNAIAQTLGRPVPFPKVPVYDAVIICDLGFEPPWVQAQADFVGQKCRSVGIFYTSLDARYTRPGLGILECGGLSVFHGGL